MSEQLPTTHSTTQAASSAAAGEKPPRDRKLFVQALIGLSAFVFLSTSAVLYYRWATTREPSCELTVMATPALRGAILKVDGPMLPKAHKVTIGAEDRYTMAFFLDPGDYDITITLNGESQYKGTCILEKMAVGTLDLTRKKPTTQPVVGPLPPISDDVVTPTM